MTHEEEGGGGLRCCVDCFANEWLRGYVRENSGERGACSYCEAKDVELIDTAALYGPFNNLLDLFTRSDDPHGDPLIDLIQGEHEVFAEQLYSSGEAARLLENILATGWDGDSGEPSVDVKEDYYVRSRAWFHATWFDAWQNFCTDVRMDPAYKPPLPALLGEELARMEAVVPSGTALFRARVGFVGDGRGARSPYEGADIGAPRARKTKPGRANAEGEEVLYVADQEATAVAEVRPWRGVFVSVAEMRTVRDLRIVDLSKAPPASNPFTSESPQHEREIVELLVAFGQELGRPVRRADDPSDYLPCQKLVRRIRECVLYDGIRYPSPMAPGGTNVVIFEPSLTEIGLSKLVEVKEIGVTYGELEDE